MNSIFLLCVDSTIHVCNFHFVWCRCTSFSYLVWLFNVFYKCCFGWSVVGYSLTIDIIHSKAESTLVHLYVVPTQSCYLWCAALPYGAPSPQTSFLKCMTQFHLEATTNEVILNNLVSETDYSVYCYAEEIGGESTPMTNSIASTRTDISTTTRTHFFSLLYHPSR